MCYQLESATERDKPWLDDLRRAVYKELMIATFGTFDEDRHQRHCDDCWEQGNISIVEVDGRSVGMIQVAEDSDSIEVCEVHLSPDNQGKQLGRMLLQDVIDRATASNKRLILSVGLKNERAKAFYERTGFQVTGQSESHFHMRFVDTSSL